MDKIKFYKEKSTGKCIPSNLSLPGDEYMEIIPNTVDAAFEKHVPVYEISNDEVIVRVGEVEHPMTEEHYIMWIALVKDENIYLKGLSPDDSPVATFKYEKDSEIYAYCNLHGLWKKEVK